MKKIIFILLAILIGLGVVYAASEYYYTIFIRTKVVMQDDGTGNTQSAKTFYEVGSADEGEYIYASADGQLDLVAATEIQIAATTIDINGAVDITGRIDNGTVFWTGAPSTASNDVSAYFTYFTDFIGEVLFPVSTGVAGGWKSVGDATYDVLSAAGSLGGWLLIAPEAASNNEVYFQLGQIGTETYVEMTASSGKEVWLEFNLTPSSVTNAASWIVGIAEEGAAAANFIVDAGNDIADKDLIGFVVWEGDPNALLAIHQQAGGAFVVLGSTAITAVNMTLGIQFDGATTIVWYVDGTSIGTVETGATGFPDTEELSPIIAMKQGAADVNINIDWIKLVVER